MITHSKQAGASLLEVMIALFVLAIGLLGFAGLQTEGITMGRQAYMHSQATFLAQDIVERILANRGQANAYATNIGDVVVAGTNCATANCSPSQQATWDRAAWLTNVANALPGGLGAVTITNSGSTVAVAVTIQYQLARGRINPGESAINPVVPQTYNYTLDTTL